MLPEFQYAETAVLATEPITEPVFLVPDQIAPATTFCVSLSSAAAATAFPIDFRTVSFDANDAIEDPTRL